MGNLGMAEVLVVLVVGLLVFGPERLPEMARNVANFVKRFREEASQSVAELKRAADLDGIDEEVRAIQQDMKKLKSSLTESVSGSRSSSPSSTEVAPAEETSPPTDLEAT